MKISCLRSDLVTALSNVSRAVSTKAAIPALEGVLIKAYGSSLNVSGYNLEIGITTDIEATVNQEGEIVLSARLLLDIVRRLPEEIDGTDVCAWLRVCAWREARRRKKQQQRRVKRRFIDDVMK